MVTAANIVVWLANERERRVAGGHAPRRSRRGGRIGSGVGSDGIQAASARRCLWQTGRVLPRRTRLGCRILISYWTGQEPALRVDVPQPSPVQSPGLVTAALGETIRGRSSSGIRPRSACWCEWLSQRTRRRSRSEGLCHRCGSLRRVRGTYPAGRGLSHSRPPTPTRFR